MTLQRALFAVAFVMDCTGLVAAHAQIGLNGAAPGQTNPIGYIPSKQSSA
jgi:hypothetical protein